MSELEKYCIISEIGVGDYHQPKETMILKNEFVCKELANYELSTLSNSSIVSQDSNQIVIDVAKNPTALNESIRIENERIKNNTELMEKIRNFEEENKIK